MATKLPWRFKLNPNALDLMADAMGRPDHIFGRDGRPVQSILLGPDENPATASNTVNERTNLHADTVATIITRYAQFAGVTKGQALDVLFETVSTNARCEIAA